MSDLTQKVQLQGGAIKGLKEGSVFRAQGIKYAEAKRWETPRLLERWEGTLDGTRPASACPQLPARLSFVTGDILKGHLMSEHCLHLSICAPNSALGSKSKLPVMVFLHGGAYVSGAGDLDCYNPQELANAGIVSVVVTYRLGIFGFAPVQDVAPANLGLMDQITSLKWVQNNIPFLGGDPERVTVVGQSVGAYSIYCMMASDCAGNLFQRAILHSACFGWPTIPSDKSEHLTRFAALLLAGKYHTASQEEILEAQGQLMKEGRRIGVPFACWPRFGEDPLPDISQVDQKLRLAAPKCPILIGWVWDEGAAFVPMLPSYPSWSRLPLIGSLLKNVMVWWSSGQEFIWPSQRFHQKHLQNGGTSSTFSLQWRPRGSTLGAVHCIDMPFILGSWAAWKDAPMVQGHGAQEVVERVGQQMRGLWAAFISGEKTPCKKHFNIDERFVYGQ